MTQQDRLRALVEQAASFDAIRAQGAGGQNVNKVSSAVQLRLDLHALPISAAHRTRLLATGDQRISSAGVLVIKAQSHRSQPLNRADAIERAVELLLATASAPRPRVATKPTRASQRRRVDDKRQRSAIKAGRRQTDE